MNSPTNAISPTESKWIEEQISAASLFVSKYSDGQALSLLTLESAWDNWIATNPTNTEEVNQIINAVGCAFGQALVDSELFNWVIAEDSNGTDLAILADPGKGDYLVYPANLVSKRWASHEAGFICNLANSIAAEAGNVPSSDPVRRPWWRLW